MSKKISSLLLALFVNVSVTEAATSKLEPTKRCVGSPTECEAEAKRYLEHYYESVASSMYNSAVQADWAYNTDLLNSTAEQWSNEANIALANFIFSEWQANISQYDWEGMDKNSLVRRQLMFLNGVGTAALPPDSLAQYNQVLTDMSKIYGTAKVCPYNNQNCNVTSEGLSLEPNLESIIANSKDYDELGYIWKSWRDNSGRLIRNLYNEYVDLGNEASILNGYQDLGEFWLRSYESPTFKEDIESLWTELKPLYDELHGYVRFRLQEKFPGKIADGEPIPAHVLGNMWSQTWEGIYSDVVPFPDAPIFDVTDTLKEKFNATKEGIYQLFDVANDFFMSLGLENMTMSYGDKGMIVKPDDKEVVCHASAWDFYDGQDYRIKMCTNVDQEDFITIHHELGHIQYFLNYRHQPIAFREGANPGFHEAIGDVVALSVATVKHMTELGYMEGSPPSTESTINYLMKIALEKVAFLPFGYLIDSYRWKIFDGTIPRDNLTYHWIKMRSDYQGIVPPVIRTENDFDPAAKYHVPGNTPYIRYFVSFILQFQIHKALCIEAGQYIPENPDTPLYNCDIYRNGPAGVKFQKLLEAGMSVNWETLLNETIGESKMSAAAIKEYFQPLTAFLSQERIKHGYSIGWRNDAFEEFYSAVRIR